MTVHRCRGWSESFSLNAQATGLVKGGDVKVMILAETLEVEPKTTGRVVVDGRTLAIVDVRRDPAGAAREIQARL